MCPGESVQDSGAGKVEIYTLEDLLKIPGNSEKDYILMADIDCQGKAIDIKLFRGKFDGNYHKIENASSAIFESIFDGHVYNLAVSDSSSSTAGVATELLNGSITNCYVTGEIGKEAKLGEATGGIVAKVLAKQCSIANCYNAADVYGSYDVGGIVGNVVDNGSDSVCPFQMSYCENYGDVYAADSESAGVGGICGDVLFEKNVEGYDGQITFCGTINYGTIHGSGNDFTNLAGVVGSATVKSYSQNSDMLIWVDESANYGRVEYSGEIKGEPAGICGQAVVVNNEYNVAKVRISDCLNSSVSKLPVLGEATPGYGTTIAIEKTINLSDVVMSPMYGRNYVSDREVDIKDCYFFNYGSGETTEQNATGLPKDAMRQSESFESFSFESLTWSIKEDYNNGYPYMMDYRQIEEFMSNAHPEAEN